MIDPASPSETAPAALPSANDARDIAVLRELTDLAMTMARRVEARCAAAPNNDPSAPDLTPAMDRIARTIRRTIALRKKLEETPPQPEARPGPPTPQPPARIPTRKRIIREVGDHIGRRHRDGSDAENLLSELNERLDDPDLDADILTRPVDDIIAEICRDLGVATGPGVRYWARRTPADLAALRARAADPTRNPDADLGTDPKISHPFGKPRGDPP